MSTCKLESKSRLWSKELSDWDIVLQTILEVDKEKAECQFFPVHSVETKWLNVIWNFKFNYSWSTTYKCAVGLCLCEAFAYSWLNIIAGKSEVVRLWSCVPNLVHNVHLMQFCLQSIASCIQGISDCTHIENTIQIINICWLNFFPQSCGECVNHRHQEETIEFQLHWLYDMVTNTYKNFIVFLVVMSHLLKGGLNLWRKKETDIEKIGQNITLLCISHCVQPQVSVCVHLHNILRLRTKSTHIFQQLFICLIRAMSD